MLEIKDVVSNVQVYGLENAMKVCRYPMSTNIKKVKTDDKRLKALAKCDSSEGHDNALCGIVVQFDLTFTVKAWVEFERYHFADIISSQSTMHKIAKLGISKDNFIEYTDDIVLNRFNELINDYNALSNELKEKANSLSEDELKQYKSKLDDLYLRVLYSCPAGLKLTAGITTNYRQLKTIDKQRNNHRLPEWRVLCKWIRTLPYSELITYSKEEENDGVFEKARDSWIALCKSLFGLSKGDILYGQEKTDVVGVLNSFFDTED